MRKRLLLPLIGTTALGLVAGGLWLYRTPIVTRYVDRTLADNGVRARYTIDHIGLRTQRLSNVVIGDPARPDLVAKEVVLTVDAGLSGVRVTAVRARGVQLIGRVKDGALLFGQLDKLLPKDDGKPPEIPDMELDIADSRLGLATPWGAVGLSVKGKGYLRNGFAGRVVARAPRIAAAQCSARSLTADVAVRVSNGAPSITGPLGIAELACPARTAGAAMALRDVRIGVKAAVAPDFRQVEVESGLRTGRASAGQWAARSLDGTLTTRYAAGQPWGLRWDVSGRQAQSRWVSARAVQIEGRGDFAKAGDLRLNGTASVTQAVLASGASVSLRRLRAAGQGTPIGPVAVKLADALAAAGRNLSGSAQYTAFGDAERGTEVAVGDLALRSASGAALSFSGERAISWSASRGLALALDGRIGGGGLPVGTVSLLRAGTGHSLRGALALQPYANGNAVIALAPLSFVATPGGGARFTTGAALSGPLADGFVDRLTMPIEGRISPAGAFSITGSCHALTWRRITLSSLSLDADAVRLCGVNGQPLLTAGPGGIAAAARIDALALSGRVGASPLHMAISGGEVRSAGGRFTLRDVTTSIGEGEGATRFAATELAGALADGGALAGQMRGANGKIGPVPLLLSEADGAWRFANRRLTLTTGLTVTDALTDAPRFTPLRSDAVELSYADNRIMAQGLLKNPESGATILDLSIRHDLGSVLSAASGEAHLLVPPLPFRRDGLQPTMLTGLAQAVVANVDGDVTGSGTIRWSGSSVTSHGRFSTDRLDLAAAFGPVQRLAGTIEFDDLLGLHTPPGQLVTIGSINPGIEVVDGRIAYQLLGPTSVRIEGGRWPFASGTLTLQPALLNFSAERPRRLVFDVEGVDAGLFLQSYEFENLSASGIFDGVLPTVFDADGGRVEGGNLVARDGGGTLAYVGELSNNDLGFLGNMAFGALKSLRYDGLGIRLNGRIDGEMVTEVRFTGLAQGAGARNNFLTSAFRKLPFTFNIRITAPFRQLLSSARGFYDPSVLIEQNLPALLRAQRAAEAAQQSGQPAEAPPGAIQPSAIQPSESEDR